MTGRLTVLALGLAACACSGTDEGALSAAAEIALTTRIANPDVSGREAFWTVRMGDGDVADAYTLSPAPPQGAVLAILASPTDRTRTLTVEIVRPDDEGTVVATFRTSDKAVRFLWPVDGAFFLRLRAPADAPAFDALIGLRSIEGRPPGWKPPAPSPAGARAAEEVPDAGPLVVPLPLTGAAGR
jgi:hypothetical protein